MSGKYRQQPKDLLDLLSDVFARLEKLERLPRIGNTSVDSGNLVIKNGNSVVVNNNGSVEVIDAHGNVIVFIGRLPNAYGAGIGQNLVQFFRQDGTKIFEASTGDYGAPPQATSFRFFDNRLADQGVPLISDHAIAGGLRDPRLGVPWVPESIAQSSSTGSLVAIGRAAFYMYHYMTKVECDITCAAGSTGQIVVAMDFPGVATFTVASKAFDSTTASPLPVSAYTQTGVSAAMNAGDLGYVAPIYNGGQPDVQNFVRLVVSVQRTSGAGTVSARVRSWNNGGA